MSKSGLDLAISIAETEYNHWVKEALKHRRPGGYRSDHAENDLERARIAQRIINKLKEANEISS